MNALECLLNGPSTGTGLLADECHRAAGGGGWHGLTEPYDQVAEWVPSTASLSQRLQLFSALALLGAGQFREPEAALFQSTLSQLRDSQEWKQVFAVLGRLDSDRIDGLALAQLQQVITSLGTSDDDYSVRVERLNLQDLLQEQQFRLLSARSIMLQTLAQPRAQRLSSTADMYAEIDGGFAEILTPWAASRLLRETWGAEPAQQKRHQPQPERMAEVGGSTGALFRRWLQL